MKRTHVATALLITLAIGFISGRLSEGNGSANEMDASSSPDRNRIGRTRTSERSGKEAPYTHSQRLREEIRKASPEALSALLYRSLEIADPLLRRQLVMEIYGRMDAGNFEAMIRESERNSLETGRSNNDEWIVLLVRSGQVAGQQAVELWSGDLKRNWDQISRSMWGWGSADPEAALKWVQERDLPPLTRANLLGSLMAGAISKNRDQAMNMLAALPEADRLNCVSPFIHHLIQNEGKDGMIHWLKSVTAADSGTEYTKKVTDQVFDKMVWSGANQYNIPAVVADMERFASVVPLDDSRISRAISQVRARDPIQGIVFLDQLSRSPILSNQSPTPAVYSQSIEPAVNRDRAGVEKWLAENPDSPIHAKVTEALNRPPRPSSEPPEIRTQ